MEKKFKSIYMCVCVVYCMLPKVINTSTYLIPCVSFSISIAIHWHKNIPPHSIHPRQLTSR